MANGTNNSYDAALEQVNQQIADMEAAEAQAYSEGLNPGEYNLSALTKQQADKRVKEAESQSMFENGITDGGGGTTPVQQEEQPQFFKELTQEEYLAKPQSEQLEYQAASKIHSDRLQRFKQAQSKFNKELFDKNPQIMGYYDDITKLLPWERKELFNKIKEEGKDFSISPEEMQAISQTEEFKQLYPPETEEEKQLAENDPMFAYKKYVKDRGYTLGYMRNKYKGTYDIAGTTEPIGSQAAHGLRSAALLQYTGIPRTLEESQASYQKWAEEQGYK